MHLAEKTARTDIADLAHTEEDERLTRHRRAWDAYDGEGPLPFTEENGQPRDNVRLDYSRLIVDKGVSFLAGKGGVALQFDPAEQSQADSEEEGEALRERARAELDAAWPEEDRHADFHRLATNGGVTGHAWLRLYETAAPEVLDSSNVTVVWSADNIGIVERYLVDWLTLDARGVGVARRHRIEPDDPNEPTAWVTYEEEWDEETNEWRALDEEGTPWRHPYPPLVGAQNLPSPNTFYGEPDLTPAVLDQIEQIESVASDMRRVIRFHGHPTPVALGVNADQIQELSVAIGEMLAIPGQSEKLGFTQLQIAELTSALSLYRTLKTALFEAVRIPKVALGETDNSGPSSGVALQVEYEPLLEKTHTKRLMYGLLLRQAAERILDLRGMAGWRVTLSWPQLLPSDEKTEAETLEADLRMGVVSKQTAAEKRGYDWSVEAERLGEERLQAARRFDAGLDDGDPEAAFRAGGGILPDA